MKRRLAAALVAIGSVAGAAALWRRRSGAGKDRVDVYFAALFPVARRILAQARS